MRKSFALGKAVFGVLVAGFITVQAAVISGKISIGTSATGLVGAIVTFQTFNGGVVAYSDTTIAGGAYALPTIPDGSTGLFSVTATGYTMVPEILQAAIVTGVVTKNVAMTAAGQPTAADSGIIQGTVTDSASLNALNGAQIILIRRTTNTAGTPIDTSLSANGGKYLFDSLPTSGYTYTMVVTITGYSPYVSAPITLRANASKDTVNVRLAVSVPPACIVKGTVTDSVTHSPIVNAKVLLRKRGNNPQQWTAVDSMVSANGAFRFDSLDSAGTYSLVVSEPNHVTYTSPTAGITFTANSDSEVVAVVLAPVKNGTLVVYVSNNGTASSGVSVSAVEKLGGNQTGVTLTGSTSATGYISFANITTGSYDVTAAKSSFTTVLKNIVVTSPGPDTLRDTLTTATVGTSKLVKGAVHSGTNAVLVGTVVILSATAAAQPTLTLTDTADANGLYAISGIPTVYTRVTLAFSKTGYTTKDTANVRLSITSDTTTINIVLVQPASVVSTPAHFGLVGISLIRGEKGGILRFGANLQSARVSMIDLNGRIVMTREIPAGAQEIALPASLSGKRTIVRIEQGAQVIQKSVVLP